MGVGPGLPASDSTRRPGLVAFQDIRPTLTGARSVGDDGTVIRVAGDPDPAGTATWLDRRAGALVTARTLAIPLLALVALLALLAAWRAAGRGGGPGWERAALALLAVTLALPPGYLAASTAEPTAARLARALSQGLFREPGTARAWGLAWLAAGLAAAVALAAVARWLDRRPPAGRAEPGRFPAPVLLGGVLLALVAADLARGGDGMTQPWSAAAPGTASGSTAWAMGASRTRWPR